MGRRVFEVLEHTLLRTGLLTPMYVNVPYCIYNLSS